MSAVMTGTRSPFRAALGAMVRRPAVVVALVWVGLLVLISVFPDFFAPYDPLKQDLSAIFEPPSATHWLGTDNLGRDILSRLIFGSTGMLQGAVLTAVVAVVIGVVLGLVAGYFGGWADSAVSFYVNVLLSVPGFVIIVTVAFISGNNVVVIMASLGVVFSSAIARLVRGSTQAARNLLYVDSARVSGLSTPRIITRHVFPNVTGPLIVQTFLFLAQAFLILASLSFLGLGFDPQSPDWGQLVQQATQEINDHPWLMVPIGAALIFTVLAFNQLGAGLRESLPQNRRESMLVSDRPRVAPKPANLADRALTPDGTSGLAAPRELVDEDLALDVRDLTVSFPQDAGEIAVVDTVSLHAKRGEVLGLVGESGCGKSMTALAVLGLVPAPGAVQAASVSIAGHVVSSMSEKDRARLRGRTIAMIGQEPMVALDPCFTAGSALVEALRANRGMSRSEAKATALELLTKVGIARPMAVFQSYPHQLSGGMAQRVAIALALTGKPEILIADEPTTALDVTIQAEILDLLLDLRDSEGMTIVLVTHDLGVLADVGDRVAVMYAGEIIETGTTADVFARPGHPYTRGLLAAVPDAAAEGDRLAALPGRVPLPRDWPTGCRFAERCAFRMPACTQAPVDATIVDAGHLSRCLAAREVAAISPAHPSTEER
ncbi:dipeptide/oligopeptide/nickel ABC transporter permease/ATP-binding protein [Actinotalea sp. M2MS4P-6]|uniref:dipeptide/oligopeptide/nickel ABC transporter permease/ATP-binding protein n=1 Tax=Actinotalea sp. M2MS4P-6 TaxID=2983762 RepID=UPI0021E50B61|nr:dipeptide/oligopeptide/nickel ABC transporter permease/ATP-binding protein [Actinotalea sp. M2MS4P-6]MCV2394388.1 dipeptide/oligopeptide/nickel ABC transporter permease/ATP-binding protein [Actinotalea sp. M2MS4P-6]